MKMLSYTVTVQHHFDAAHYLPGHPKCGKLHGHRWEVTVRYDFNDGTPLTNGMFVDFGDVKAVIDQLDHGAVNLNEMFEYPTAEVIAEWLHANMPMPEGMLHPCFLVVTVHENPECSVTCMGRQEGQEKQGRQEHGSEA